MTQENKELLLRDLCARLPYGIKAQIKHYDAAMELLAISANGTTYATAYGDMECLIETFVEDCKPYLFPLSSMTKEQESYIHFNTKFSITRFGNVIIKTDEDDYPFDVDEDDWLNLFDWFSKNHFDYRGLIEKGLAIDATESGIY